MKKGIASIIILAMSLVLVVGCTFGDNEEDIDQTNNEEESRNEVIEDEDNQNNNQEKSTTDTSNENKGTNDENENENSKEENESSVGKEINEEELNDPIKALVFEYYHHLMIEEFEDSIHFIDTGYLDYLGVTKRDYVNMYKDSQTLNGWRIEDFSIRSADEITIDVRIPLVFEELVTSNENYIVIIDLMVRSNDRTVGVVDEVLVSTDELGNWKIFGIVSY
ncbi:hypothetical protein QA612_06330 [Evansella sp. AB-P1]|uniref:hypothetical protein n=1 Tax=Evansella sp. AB-P1 TaxID=3037653 RepID=UPI00241DB448|nr:hypothetical protein [Evansella sp. AB-P1]MDG5787104.1 hypothetical protein [Evansella sp. AB-P1]